MPHRRARLFPTPPTDRPSARRLLVDFAREVGFDVVAFLEPVRRSLDGAESELRAAHALAPAIAVLREDRVFSIPLAYPVEVWPIAAQSAASEEPFIWLPNEPRYFAMMRLPQVRQVSVRAFFRRFGVRGAVTTPVHVGEHDFGFVTWFCCAETPPPPEQLRGLFGELRRAAGEFLGAYPGLPPSGPRVNVDGLSQRQLDCLRWAALGKTNDEIAELIGRSVETVRFHLKKSARTLNANNRTHAVALASYLQLLGDIADPGQPRP